MAQLGLGLCSEELGQTAQAADIYRQIADNDIYQATVLAELARHRLEGLKDNSETFNFADAPVAPEEATSADTGAPAAVGPEKAASADTPAPPETQQTPPAAQDSAEKVSDSTASQP